MSAVDKMDCALDLMRRLPPQYVEQNLSKVVDLVPELCADLLSSVDQPLKVVRDDGVGKDFLVCDYNRDGDSHRSPFSNLYFPPLDDGIVPSDKLREVETFANEAFDKYRELYYEGGLSSVYLWDIDPGFAGAILMKKSVNDPEAKVKGCWDSINVIEVVPEMAGNKSAHYKLTTTIMLWLQSDADKSGNMNLGGSITRQSGGDKELVGDFGPAHVKNIGELVEEMETKCRLSLNDIYFGKTKDVTNMVRSVGSLVEKNNQDKLQNDLMQQLMNSRNK
ncbi:F-actin-capping protein subunit beta-like [Symsagittifera roscoffensis]|uniref:F-actin-capping protein subunit beta-like n=1 Tax=Symsagittifera roscoffensis TaxID=84072 RepID=UPI00307B36AB